MIKIIDFLIGIIVIITTIFMIKVLRGKKKLFIIFSVIFWFLIFVLHYLDYGNKAFALMLLYFLSLKDKKHNSDTNSINNLFFTKEE